MTVWFTSDLHFGHELVASHRGFDDVLEHDLLIQQNWRRDVRSQDIVWVLGDLTLKSPDVALSILANLPGRKHLIFGNHDSGHPMHSSAQKHQARYLTVFETVQTLATRKIEGQKVMLSHFPYTKDRGEVRYMQYRLHDEGAFLLHGHTHSTVPVAYREINVALDAWQMAPVNLETIQGLVRDGLKLPTSSCTRELHEEFGGACYYCCQTCNYAEHRCHFCGDDLRHDNSQWSDLPGTPNPCYVDADANG